VLKPGARHERHRHRNCDEFFIVIKGRGHIYSDLGEEPSVEGDECGPLEPRCVRSVDYDLAHEVGLDHRFRIQQECDLQGDVQRLRVRRMWRLFVRLDEARIRGRFVYEREAAFRFLECGRVDLAHLRLRRPQPAAESDASRFLDEDRFAFAEQLARRELLVELEPDLQAQRSVVHRLTKSRRRD